MSEFFDPIPHRLYDRAMLFFGNLCRDAPDGRVIVMVGPTQAGKSFVFNQIIKLMQDDRRHAPVNSIPLARVQLESVGEGRVKGKWLCLQLLKTLKHPVYMHIGDIDELDHYTPSRGRDEGTLRNALKSALVARMTQRVALDEAHLLTRTKSSEFRGSILESLKSIAAIERTLIACGGYELTYRGLFDSAHFSGRTVVFDFGYYRNVPDDIVEWIKILRYYGERIPLEKDDLLVKRAEPLLLAANGSIGLLAKWLWTCKVQAECNGSPISQAILSEQAPRIKEQEAIAVDIRLGQEALASSPISTSFSGQARRRNEEVEGADSHSDASQPRAKKGRRPFEARPRRAVIGGIEVWSHG